MLDVALVRTALGLFASRLNDSTVEDLAHLLESREELFAYIFTRDEFLTANEDVRSLIQRMAEEHGTVQTLVRPHDGSPVDYRDVASSVFEELRLLMQQRSDGHPDADEFRDLEMKLRECHSSLRSSVDWIRLRQPDSKDR